MIEIQDLSKSYGNFQALQNVSFSVGQGEVVGLLGPNGAGKTTTMKIMTTFMPQSSGKVSIGGFDTLEEPMDVRKLIGYLPESNPLPPELTVHEALTFVAKIRGICGAQARTAIDRMVESCQLQNVLYRTIGVLSKGYRQRVGLAQAMIHDPQILILDEPTSGLDPNQITDMLHLIRRLGRQKTVIHSTHILSEAQETCDRILILNRGCLVANDSPQTLSRQASGHQMCVSLLDQDHQAEDLKTFWQSQPWIQHCDVQLQEKQKIWKITLDITERQHMGSEISVLCQQQQWSVTELYYQAPNLETVFARLTREGGRA